MSKKNPVYEGCREWVDDGVVYDRCTRQAEVILWGKLFPQGALGPRCRQHAEEHLDGRTLEQVIREGWAVFDLRGVER